MNTFQRTGLFEATLTGGLLRVGRYAVTDSGSAGGVFRMSHTASPLFTFPCSPLPWLVLHGDGLYAQNAQDALTPLYRGEDAAQLLSCINALLTTVESKRTRRRVRGTVAAAATAALLGGLMLMKPVNCTGLLAAPHARLLTTVDAQRAVQPGPVSAAMTALTPAAPAVTAPPANSVPDATPVLPAPTPDDGWGLPLSLRAELPEKLRKAASRGLFTVPLSSGHARTLYVFADPECPNCRRMERHFETAAGTVNVVIFPVTIEGGQDSLRTLTPVMALPEGARADAWKQLFAADNGVTVPGAAGTAPAQPAEAAAETARGALGVNEVAYRAYRLPGTPWTISDDGRYVPQAALSSPDALSAFLNGGAHDGH